MKKLLIISLILQLIIAFKVSASTNLNTIKAPKSYDNIHVHALSSNKHASEFIIFIKNEVKPHYHENHTELIFVLEGEGIFFLDDTKQMIRPRDFIRIEEKQIHSVQVTSNIPLKVLSVQTPEFLGKDRVFVQTQ